MFIPLCKVDEVSRMVYGRIGETPDRDGEVFDYASSKPNFEAWSGQFEKCTDGRSLGNLRAMHGKTAAGKFTKVDFDDDGKTIELAAHVVDDAEWEKVLEGVYTGFSPGGKYAKRWKDGKHTRYTAAPNEISLVDLPCIPSATFTLVKGDGLAEERAFKAGSGDVLAKNLNDVGRLAELINSLSRLAASSAYEASSEQDGSQIPARLRDWLAIGVAILTDMAREEATEALAGLSVLIAKLPAPAPDMALAAGSDNDLAKRGASNSKADQDKLQAIHDHAAGLGAICSGSAAEKAAGNDDLAKIDVELLTPLRETLGLAKGGMGGAMEKIQVLIADSQSLAKVSGERDTLKKRVDELEALPAPGGPMLKVIDKGQDVASPAAAASDDGHPKTFEDALRLAKAMPSGADKTRALREAGLLAKHS